MSINNKIDVQSIKFTKFALKAEAFGVGLYEGILPYVNEYWKDYLLYYIPIEKGHWKLWETLSNEKSIANKPYMQGKAIAKILTKLLGEKCYLIIILVEKFAVKGYKHELKKESLNGQTKNVISIILDQEIEMELKARKTKNKK
ncbi:MAG: hypothetical protein ACP5RS_06930 [Thermoplasmata archaeon]